MAYGIYSPDRTYRTTAVNGLSWVGLYAADGSYNIILDDVTSKGIYHPCGAIRVNSSVVGTTNHDASGAYYSNHFLGRGNTWGLVSDTSTITADTTLITADAYS